MIYGLFAMYGTKWVDILPKSNSVAWGSDKDTLAVNLSFNSLADMLEGSHIQLLVDSKLVLTGILIKKSKSKNQFNYTCIDYAWYLNKNKTVIQFNKVKSSDAIHQLCSRFGIRSNIVTINALVTKIYKDQPISDIINEILDNATLEQGTKYIKEMISNVLTVRKLIDYKIYPKFILSDDLVVNSSIEDMKTKVQVVSSDEKNNKILSTATGTNVRIYGVLQEVITVDAKDISKAKNIGTNYLKLNNKIFRDSPLNIIVTDGGEDIRANRSIELNVVSMGLKGWYNIKSCSNTLDNGQFKCSLMIEW